VLAALGRLEIYVRRLRRRVTATIRTRVGTAPEDLEMALRAHGLVIENQRVFDHSEDRTFELKLAGPSRQFEVAAGELLRRDFILGVNFD
jgi:hypothetical protein